MSQSKERSVRTGCGRIALSIGAGLGSVLGRAGQAFLAVAFFVVRAVVFLAVFLAVFFAARLRVVGPLARFSASSSAAALGGDRLGLVVLAQRRVGLAVGDVGAEPAVLDHDRLAADTGSAPSSLQRRRRRGAAALLGLGVDRQRLLEGDVEELLLGRQRARVGALLQVRAVAAVLRGDLARRSGVGADDARQRQQLQRVVEGRRSRGPCP